MSNRWNNGKSQPRVRKDENYRKIGLHRQLAFQQVRHVYSVSLHVSLSLSLSLLFLLAILSTLSFLRSSSAPLFPFQREDSLVEIHPTIAYFRQTGAQYAVCHLRNEPQRLFLRGSCPNTS